MESIFRIESRKLLAVEGKDECNFFDALLKKENLASVQTVDIGGKDKFSVELPLLIKMEGFDQVNAIGFVRDAEDQEARFAFQSICSTLKNNQLPVPDSLKTVKHNRLIKLSVFIMPDNKCKGMLEDLCLNALSGQPIDDCINDFISCFLPEIAPREREKFNKSKARVQSYLASRVPLVNSLGIAAQKDFWDFDHDCFDDIKTFLHNIFD